jgi:predicted naringenin-chalcone synthase
MSRVSQAVTAPARRHGTGRRRSALPSLLGLGTAVPALRLGQLESVQAMAALWGLSGSDSERTLRIARASGIRFRHGVLRPEDVIGLGTARRMEAYERHAPPLAARAAAAALESASVDAQRVTDLIVVSCTGFSAPGLDAALVQRLALSRSVRRTIIGFMGCFGAIIGLRSAIALCASQPGAVALVVCVELCSLHLRPGGGAQNVVASSLFADGAAAAVIGGPLAARQGAAPIGGLRPGRSLLLAEGRDWMSWRITDTGFAMTLSRALPGAMRSHLRDFAASCSGGRGGAATFIVHPGGPAILDAADEALETRGGRGLAAARAVLARHGNMSSATVLFVLDEARRAGLELPALLLAFGPGLTLEGMPVVARA